MWMTELPPFVPFFLAALILPLTRGAVRNAVILLVPVLGGLHLVVLELRSGVRHLLGPRLLGIPDPFALLARGHAGPDGDDRRADFDLDVGVRHQVVEPGRMLGGAAPAGEDRPGVAEWLIAEGTDPGGPGPGADVVEDEELRLGEVPTHAAVVRPELVGIRPQLGLQNLAHGRRRYRSRASNPTPNHRS